MSAMPTGKAYGTRLGSTHQSGHSAIAELYWNAADAGASQVFLQVGPTRLASGVVVDCVWALDNGRGMTEAVLNGSLLRLGQNEDHAHGPHSLNGHGAKKAAQHLGRETMYLSKTEEGYAVGRMGASTDELSSSNDLSRMTLQRATLDELSALPAEELIFHDNPFCATGPQLRALFEEHLTSPTGTLALIAKRHPGTGFTVDAAGRLLDAERDWAALRSAHVPKASAAAMDLADLVARATAPTCLYGRLRDLGFVSGAAPGAGMDVYVNDALVDVAALNPFDAAAAAGGVTPHIVLSDCGRFAFSAVWAKDRDAAESGVIVLTDGKNLGLVPGHSGNRTLALGASGLSGIAYIAHSMNCSQGKCVDLAKAIEAAGAPAGVALEAMLAYGPNAGNARDKQLAVYSMYTGTGLLCFLAAKPRVLKSDDPKEGCLQDDAYREGMHFAMQQLLRFTATHPAPDGETRKLLAKYAAEFRGCTVAQVVERKKQTAEALAAAQAATRREKAERDKAEKAKADAEREEQRKKDAEAHAINKARQDEIDKENKAKAKARRDALKAAAAKRMRERAEAEAKARADAAAAHEEAINARREAAQARALLAAAVAAAERDRVRPRDDAEGDGEDDDGAGPASKKAKLRFGGGGAAAGCAGCAAHAKEAKEAKEAAGALQAQLRKKEANIDLLERFILNLGLRVPRL